MLETYKDKIYLIDKTISYINPYSLAYMLEASGMVGSNAPKIKYKQGSTEIDIPETMKIGTINKPICRLDNTVYFIDENLNLAKFEIINDADIVTIVNKFKQNEESVGYSYHYIDKLIAKYRGMNLSARKLGQILRERVVPTVERLVYQLSKYEKSKVLKALGQNVKIVDSNEDIFVISGKFYTYNKGSTGAQFTRYLTYLCASDYILRHRDIFEIYFKYNYDKNVDAFNVEILHQSVKYQTITVELYFKNSNTYNAINAIMTDRDGYIAQAEKQLKSEEKQIKLDEQKQKEAEKRIEEINKTKAFRQNAGYRGGTLIANEYNELFADGTIFLHLLKGYIVKDGKLQEFNLTNLLKENPQAKATIHYMQYGTERSEPVDKYTKAKWKKDPQLIIEDYPKPQYNTGKLNKKTLKFTPDIFKRLHVGMSKEEFIEIYSHGTNNTNNANNANKQEPNITTGGNSFKQKITRFYSIPDSGEYSELSDFLLGLPTYTSGKFNNNPKQKYDDFIKYYINIKPATKEEQLNTLKRNMPHLNKVMSKYIESSAPFKKFGISLNFFKISVSISGDKLIYTVELKPELYDKLE